MLSQEPKGSLLIKKINSANLAPLSDVQFFITDSTGAVIGNSNGYFTTNSAGTILIDGIAPGTTLIAKETIAKDGYVLDDTPQAAYIKAGQTITLEFRNAPKGTLMIRKLDSITKAPLGGAEFSVRYADGRVVDDAGDKLSSNGIYTTNGNGEIVITGLTGTVVVTEEKAPDGYLLDVNGKTQTVVVNADDTQTLVFYDTPIGGLIITKSDEETAARISGVQFEVQKMNGEIVGQYTTDRNGTIRLPGLDSGWYTVTELKAASGYQLDPTPQQIEIKDGQPDSYPKVLATCRSYNIGLNIIVQNIQNIKALYEKEWESIIGNCDTLLFLGGGNEPTSLEFMVKLLGKETLDTRTRGQTKGRNGSSSTNYQQAGRELMTIDELRMMDTDDALLLIRGERPVMDKKYNIFKHPNFARTERGGAKPYVHRPTPDYALPDLPYQFTSLDDIEILEENSD